MACTEDMNLHVEEMEMNAHEDPKRERVEAGPEGTDFRTEGEGGNRKEAYPVGHRSNQGVALDYRTYKYLDAGQ